MVALLALCFSQADCQDAPGAVGRDPAEPKAAAEVPAETEPGDAPGEEKEEEENFLYEGVKVPEPPADDYPIADYAELLSEEQEKELHQVQLASWKKHDTPIVVVTIQSMREYGPSDWSIERFAYTWFNKWQIGKRGGEGELVNRGILLLVSFNDRKARIELGADWGRGWDKEAAFIMNTRIVPSFKKGDFPGGIAAGARALAELAGAPRGKSPPGRSSLADRIGAFLLILFGGGLLGTAMFFASRLGEGRGFSGDGGGDGGGGWGGGGYSSGGFSGGGGASGSW